ncbi:MAG: hypothetical protein ACJ8E3_00850 [Sphingomicrobium sp.]
MTALGHPLTWAAPRPLWRGAGAPGLAPTILRFANDEFMDELIGLLDADPKRLPAYVARFESWRSGLADRPVAGLVERVPLPAPVKQARLRTRLRKPAIVAPAPAEPRRLKLYQPAHQRHYVAAATLACAIHGLPDRKLAGDHERVGFVVRRLLTASANAPSSSPRFEYAFVKDDGGSRWQRVSDGDPAVLAPGEELLPVFPLAHREGNGIRRTMWGGLVQVGRREEYMSASVTRSAQALVVAQRAAAAAAATPPAPRNSKLARTAEFKLDFAEPWKALIQAAMKAADEVDSDRGDKSSTDTRQLRLRNYNLGYQHQSWLLLLDLMAFLDRHLKDVAGAIRSASPAGLAGPRLELFQWLGRELTSGERDRLANGFALSTVDATGRPAHVQSIAEALRRIDAAGLADKLESAEILYEDKAGADARGQWPGFHYLLAGIASNGNGEAIDAHGGFRTVSALAAGPASDPDVAGLNVALKAPADFSNTVKPPPQPFDVNEVDRLTILVARALDTSDEAGARELPFAQKLSQSMRETAGDQGLFLIRFVHLNADCGPLHPPVLSRPSETFELASFFDPDAPARPVRISLPMDTSPAGLRKHARGTAFVLSNMLCGQVQRAKGLGLVDLIMQVLPWPLHKDIDMGDGGGCKDGNDVDIGMICSLSIPIITLCALILLMVIVFLLDFVFRWVPWLIMCFPVPTLKGKTA